MLVVFLYTSVLLTVGRRKLSEPHRGQAQLEYLLLMTLIVLLGLVGLEVFGMGVSGLFEDIAAAL